MSNISKNLTLNRLCPFARSVIMTHGKSTSMSVVDNKCVLNFLEDSIQQIVCWRSLHSLVLDPRKYIMKRVLGNIENLLCIFYPNY